MKKFDFHSSEARALIRLTMYTAVLSVVGVIAIFLVYAANGYDIDRDTGQVIRNGLILIESNPESAKLFVNGVDEDDTPSKLAVPIDTYDLRLTSPGYKDWTKKLIVHGTEVDWVSYPTLIPDEVTKTNVVSFIDYKASLQSKDNRFIFVNTKGADFSVFETADSQKPPVEFSVPLTAFTAEDEAGIGEIEMVDTSSNGNWLLLKHTPLSDPAAVIYLLVPWNKPAEFVDMSLESGVDIASIKPLDDDAKEFYLRSTNTSILYKYNRTNDTTTSVSFGESSLIDFDNTEKNIAYVTRDMSGQVNVYASQNFSADRYLVSSLPADASSYKIDIVEYERDNYLSIVYDETALIFKNPFTDEEQLPIRVISIAAGSETEISTRSRFFSYYSGTSVVAYDIDEDRNYRYEIDNSHGRYSWISNFHFTAMDASGVIRMMEFDGNNTNTVIDIASGSAHYYSIDLENLTLIEATADGGATLSSASMLVN